MEADKPVEQRLRPALRAEPAERGFDRARLPHLLVCRQRRGSEVRTPYIDGDEQEQPHHVDAMPVPGSRLETEVMLWPSLDHVEPLPTDGEEDGAPQQLGNGTWRGK